MKKIIYRCIIVIFLLAFCTVSISSPIYAAADKIQLTDVSVSSKSEGTTVSDLIIDGSTIRGAITLPSKDNFAELKLSFTNNDSENYTIDSISDNYTGDYLNIEYRYDSVLSAGATSDVFAKIIYKRQIMNQPDFSIEDITITIKLTRSDGTSEEIVINPATSDKLPLYLAIIFASSIMIILVFRRLKRTVKYGIIVAIALLCSPMVVLAAEKCELQPVIEIVILKSEYEQYDISIDPDDGSEPTIKKIKYGDPIGEIPDAPERTGYDHAGWVDEDGNDVTSETIITGPMTIKPKYVYNGFTITFDANGGEGEMTSQIFDLNTSTALNANTFARRGYEFKGWNTSPDGDGSNYSDGQSVSFTEKGEMTLYAKWLKLEAAFKNGRNINVMMHRLSGYSTDGAYNAGNYKVKHFVRSEVMPDMSTITSSNVVSLSTVPIYMWFDNGTIYWWTEDIDPSLNADCYGLFDGFRALEELDLSDIDASNVTNMHEMFTGDASLTSLILGDKFDTSNVMDMYEMFSGLSSLTSLDLGDKFDTSKVTTMRNMFAGLSSLTSLDLGDKFDTGKVTTMYGMFSGLSSLTSLDLGDKFDTSKVWEMPSMFSGLSSLTSLDLGDKFDTSRVNNMIWLFRDSSSLESLDLGDKFDTSNVTSMYQMFINCSSLISLDLGNKFNTKKVNDMTGMFSGLSSLTSLDLGDNFDTSSVTKMSSMFKDVSSLSSLDLGDSFNTANVTSMGSMFDGMASLTSLDLGDKFNTINATGMDSMFRGMTNLTSLDLGDTFNTSNVAGMSYMFSGVSSLTSLDLGDKFDTGNVTYMWAMFENMASLTSLDLGDKFNTENVTVMRNMFYGMSNLISLNLGDKFDTSKVWDMRAMFMRLSKLTVLDLGEKFYTTSIQTMDSIFRDCGKLVTIYATEAFDSSTVRSGSQLFQDDVSLVGGAGTAYDSRYAYGGLTHAHIDGGVSNPGYFTRRP